MKKTTRSMKGSNIRIFRRCCDILHYYYYPIVPQLVNLDS